MKNKKLLKKIALLSLSSAIAFPLSSCLSMAATLYIQGGTGGQRKREEELL